MIESGCQSKKARLDARRGAGLVQENWPSSAAIYTQAVNRNTCVYNCRVHIFGKKERKENKREQERENGKCIILSIRSKSSNRD